MAAQTLPACSTGTHLSLVLQSLSFTRLRQWQLLWFVDSCAVLPFLVPPTVTSCSVHIHNVVAKKRDASSSLRRLHAHMFQHNVDFIGRDFNKSAFSTVGDAFTDTEFTAPGNSQLWGLGALDDSCRERTGFLIMPKRPCEWRVDSHGCYKFKNADLALGPRDTTAHFPVFLHLRSTDFPGPDSITRSVQAQQRRMERKATKHEREQSRPDLPVPSLRENIA